MGRKEGSINGLSLLFIAILLFLVVACAAPAPKATSEPTPTQTQTPVSTPAPTTTATPTPSVTPTPSPTPTTKQTTSSDDWGLWGYSSWPKEYKATPGAKLLFLTTQGYKCLIASGLPEDKIYYLWQKRLDKNVVKASEKEMSIERMEHEGKDVGVVVTRADGHPVLYKPAAFAKGEAFEVALISEDKAFMAFGKEIFNPIESKQGPYRMWVELESSEGELFTIWCEGFDPNEEIVTVSTSEGEFLKSKYKVDKNGRWMLTILPAVVGKKSGLATFSAAGKSGEVKVSYQWGPPAIQRGP